MELTLFDLSDDGFHNCAVLLDQIQPRFTRLLVRTCRNHDHCGIDDVIVGSCIYLDGVCEYHAMADVQRFSFRTAGIRID